MKLDTLAHASVSLWELFQPRKSLLQGKNNLNLSFGIIAMGANLPAATSTPADSLRAAMALLHSEPDVSITRASQFWRTPAHPPGSGRDFVNAAAGLLTSLTPQALLERLHMIEARIGRDRSTGRWSARVLDLDLIGWSDLILPDVATLRHWMALPPDKQAQQAPDRLILPHPRMHERGFVLVPLAQIAPQWRHPLTGQSVARMLAALPPSEIAQITPIRA